MFDHDQCGMEAEQAECAGRVRQLWSSHARLEREAHALRGGIIWKKARGHDYLYRYFQDPLTRSKRFEGRGRRSDETEAEHARYLTSRERVHGDLARSTSRIETVGRVARAFRLARFPASLAALIHGLWLEGLFDEDLKLMGAPAMMGYELEGEFLSPPALFRGESLHVLVRDVVEERLADLVDSVVTSSDHACTLIRRDRDHLVYAGGRNGRVEFHSTAGLSRYFRERGLDRERLDVVMEATALPAWQGVAVSRDSKVIPVTSVDPRAYAMLAQAAAEMETDSAREEMLRRRAGLIAWATSERMGLEFGEEHLVSFPELRDDERMLGWRL